MRSTPDRSPLQWELSSADEISSFIGLQSCRLRVRGSESRSAPGTYFDAAFSSVWCRRTGAYAQARVGRHRLTHSSPSAPSPPRRSQIALLRSWCYCDSRAVAPDVVAAEGEMEEAEGVAAAPGPASGLAFRGRRAMSGSWERDQQVEAAQRALVEVLGPYEPLLSRVQAALVWERPARSALWCLGLNAAFW